MVPLVPRSDHSAKDMIDDRIKTLKRDMHGLEKLDRSKKINQ
jgi:hypothetical protein